jgi:hypothetical protein
MAPKKLTEADKTAILGLYRHPEETTSTLAERYGVSNSTISRLLKATLPEDEYSALIQQKRSSGDRGQAVMAVNLPAVDSKPAPMEPLESPEVEIVESPEVEPEATTAAREPIKAPILKKREAPTPAAIPDPDPETTSSPDEIAAPSGAKTAPVRRRSRSQTPDTEAEATQLSLPDDRPAPSLDAVDEAEAQSSRFDTDVYDATAVEADLEESWDESSTLDDDYDEDEDDEDDEDEAWDGEGPALSPSLEALEIYPLTPQALPALCYLVVERVSSELVALPLRTFASLGQIPEEEGDSRTLPVFDNHRIARRFSRRNQRVIKVPDGALLQTTSPYLQAKGITRLLIDGQVFALEDRAEVTP